MINVCMSLGIFNKITKKNNRKQEIAYYFIVSSAIRDGLKVEGLMLRGFVSVFFVTFVVK